MTSKQEKLAAARKKLKEFQGKSKELKISKSKIMSDVLTPKIFNYDFSSNESVSRSSPIFSGSENSHSLLGSQPYQMQIINNETAEDNKKERKVPGHSQNDENFSQLQSEYKNVNQNLVSAHPEKTHEGEIFETSISDCAKGLKPNSVDSVAKKKNHDTKSYTNSVLQDENMVSIERDSNLRDEADIRTVSQNENLNLSCIEAKKFFNSDFGNKNALNETVAALQMELQSHAQTITILVQQRNDAQTALAETQSLLNKKLGESEILELQLAHLTKSVNSLTHSLFEAEAIIKKLQQEKEESLQKWNETRLLTDNFQTQLDRKKEEFQEMKRKYEEKNNDFQQLMITLKEAQAQLSLCQIQLQQNSSEEHSGLATQFAEFQNENVSLRQKVEELEKKLEVENAEKEESSQKFYTYAQQCNSQLSSLNSQLKYLKLEKENLFKENIILSKNLSDLENMKEKTSSSPYITEIADLRDQVSALSEENKKLNIDMKKKEEECAYLKSKIEEKDFELKELSGIVKELSRENEKLEREAETPKADERLLATMESDKVAAAKAVSQNQKLKTQILELEQAFMKVNNEKLELTNQLAHEKHVTAELQNMLRKSESENHDGCHSGFQPRQKAHEPLVNDSDEIEELRRIVRQLQDDKMELTARLNFYESSKKGETKEEKENGDREEEENGEQCGDSKVLLQQMKEKVRKTMNEIAILDEEKEKLEHLVLQLQGETETIGEYITLYQKQRMLLRQRAQEKDSQLLQLSKDKEELKSKLVALDELVQRLLMERESVRVLPGTELKGIQSLVQIPDNTAGKIRALINEIGSTTLINNQSIAFEHCSCCSGRLITI